MDFTNCYIKPSPNFSDGHPEFAQLQAVIADAIGFKDIKITQQLGTGWNSCGFGLGNIPGLDHGAVLKLRKNNPGWEQRTFKDRAAQKLVEKLAPEFLSKGYIVPKTLSYGYFTECFSQGNNVFSAWDVVSRVPGYFARDDLTGECLPAFSSSLAKATHDFHEVTREFSDESSLVVDSERILSSFRYEGKFLVKGHDLKDVFSAHIHEIFLSRAPSSIVHCDLNLGNLTFDLHGQVIGLFDFESLCRGYHEMELTPWSLIPGIIPKAVEEYDRLSGCTLDQELVYLMGARRSVTACIDITEAYPHLSLYRSSAAQCLCRLAELLTDKHPERAEIYQIASNSIRGFH